uniref:Uncharacterized protein n=1 Tax=Trichogramma kaykai TaxID=54128 RepID=A0ABD2WRI2_9HYME
MINSDKATYTNMIKVLPHGRHLILICRETSRKYAKQWVQHRISRMRLELHLREQFESFSAPTSIFPSLIFIAAVDSYVPVEFIIRIYGSPILPRAYTFKSNWGVYQCRFSEYTMQ